MSTLNGRTILIVDDEPDLVAVTAEVLELAGATRTRCATGGFEALEIIKTEAIDAVVSDVRMPKGTGLDLLRGLATLFTPRVFVTTARASERAASMSDRTAAMARCSSRLGGRGISRSDK